MKHQLSSKFSTGVNLNLSSFTQVGESESAGFRNPILTAQGLLPTQEAFNEDETPNFNDFVQIYDPLAIQQFDKQNNQTSK